MEHVNEARIGTQKTSRCGTASSFTVLLTVIWSFACNFGGTCSPVCLSAIASNAIICKHTFHFHITCDDTDNTVITYNPRLITATMRLAVVFVSRTSWVSGFLHYGMEPRWWQRSCRMRPQLFNTRFLWLGPCNTTSTSKCFKNLNNPSWPSLPFDTSFTILLWSSDFWKAKPPILYTQKTWSWRRSWCWRSFQEQELQLEDQRLRQEDDRLRYGWTWSCMDIWLGIH